MKKASTIDYARALFEATKDAKEEELDAIIKNFVKVLYKDGKMAKVEKIMDEYIRYEKSEKGIKNIEVTSAFPINKNIKNLIKNYIGAEVEMEEKIDENMLGGIKIKIGDKIFDAGLKTKLLNLKQSLTK